MFVINNDNYEKYKQVAKILWEFSFDTNPNVNDDSDPFTVLLKMESESKSIAKKGLKIGLLDTFADIRYLSPQMKRKLNGLLLAANLPGIDKLTAIIEDAPSKVLRRGKIKNLEEYYVIKEIVGSFEFEISDKDRLELGKILSQFEQK